MSIEGWGRVIALWLHLAGVVVWFGAVAYFLLVLRPAVRTSDMERKQWYLLLRQIKHRLRIVVGGAVVTMVLSGAWLANARGLLRGDLWSSGGTYERVFLIKMAVVASLIIIYLTALPLIARLEPPLRRGRAFTRVHIAALLLGALAAFLGLLLHG